MADGHISCSAFCDSVQMIENSWRKGWEEVVSLTLL